VQRLADLLHQRVRVRSLPGKGSVFSIEAALPAGNATSPPGAAPKALADTPETFLRKGKILVIEDDPELQDLLRLLFKDAGHRVVTASDAAGALDFVSKGGLRPDLILADYNLPNGVTGLQAIGMIREQLHHAVPAIILTGDISADTLREVASQDCLQLNKPVKLPKLAQIVQDLLPASNARAPAAGWDEAAALARKRPTIFVVDDSLLVREGLRAVLEEDGRTVKGYPTSEAFLDAYDPSVEGCLLVDAYLPGISGLALLKRLHAAGDALPAIMITGAGDVTIAVDAMKAGAVDFIEKPIGVSDLLASVDRALEQSHDASTLSTWRADAAQRVSSLTPRQHEIMDMVLDGHPSKDIAADLGISQRTVDTHRASIMKKTGSKSIPALARMALAAKAHATLEPAAMPLTSVE
jgi:two-component system CheB/CheR fusion protein